MATETISLPIINISTSENQKDTAKRMLEAALKYGFLYIDTRGTSFTPEVIEREFQLSKDFFASPEQEKEACKMDHINRGWTALYREILDPAVQKRGDFKEALNIGEFIDGHPQQPMPKCLQGHEAELFDFETCCRKTRDRILTLLALALEIPDQSWFADRHNPPSGSTVRLLHYPPFPANTEHHSDMDIRAGAHSDYGSLTLLFQRLSQPGLQIRPSGTDTFIALPPFPTHPPPSYTPEKHPTTGQAVPPIVVNIGDLLAFWTNGLLMSTVHRVVIPRDTATKAGKEDGSRYSITYFSHPCNDTLLEPVPSPLVPKIGADTGSGDEGEGEGEGDAREGGIKVGYGGGIGGRREAMTAAQHLRRRIDATYLY